MVSKLVGIHVSDLENNINILNKNKINIIQIFIDNNIKSKLKIIKKLLINNNIKLVVHASYTINLANNWDEYSPHIIQFIDEIKCAYNLGAYCIVVHTGKQLNLSKSEAINNMYLSMLYIMNKIKDYDIKILIETPSGQGSEMLCNLDDLSMFFNKLVKINNNKFRICLDTCHIFQAGFDINNKNKLIKYFKEFDDKIGLKYISLIHLNNSKNKLGLNIDRHENLKLGEINYKSLIFIKNLFLKNNVPIILETPSEKILNDYLLII